MVLDEPVNGLDPDGVRWIRLLLRSLADEGRTVLVSSHLMSEMAQMARRLVVIGRGKLIAETSVEDFIGHAAAGDVHVRTPETRRLAEALAGPAVTVTEDGTDVLRVSGLTAEQIGTAAWQAHLPVFELVPAPGFARGVGEPAGHTGQRRIPRRGGAMSAALAPAPRAIPTAAQPVTQVRVIRSEATKLRGLRSTWACALISVILIVGVGALAAGGEPYRVSAANPGRDRRVGQPVRHPAGPAGARRARGAGVQR